MPENTEQLTTRGGLKLLVERRERDGQLEVVLRTESAKKCLLHWGVRGDSRQAWQMPPQSLWPAGTRAFGQTAAQTPFAPKNGERQIALRLARPADFSSIEFALFFPDENRWDNNEGRNYQIEVRRSLSSPDEALRREIPAEVACFHRIYDLESGGQLAAAVSKQAEGYQAALVTGIFGPVLLHWGIARRSPYEWLLPPSSMHPPETVIWQNGAAETPFSERGDGLKELRLEFKLDEAPLGIPFVLRQISTGRWIKDRGGNFFIPIHAPSPKPGALVQELERIADEIINAEMSRNSWTLMHRFNLCYDLLDRAGGGMAGGLELWALLFVWLRFSAIRQLDWQRNYNTKPRELSHAQDRLTLKLADLYAREPGSRPLVRLMMTTVGRGGEGQKIRDEILGIMHRHNIKEVTGHFLEEWHQKLHNNTTPDDVVICEAYLAFLHSNGSLDVFYRTLESAGVTRARLESFERPIRTEPTFVGRLKDGLIRDFEHFLRTLKAVHSGVDLETATNEAQHSLDDHLRGLLSYLVQHRNDEQVPLLDLVDRITETRRRLSQQLTGDRGSRDLLYLDLALEQFLRVAVERSIHQQLGEEPLVNLVGRVTENLLLSYAVSEGDGENAGATPSPVIDGSELLRIFRHWERLKAAPRFDREWSLHAKAVLDRMAGALGALTDSYYQLLQPKAELLGNAFRAAPWTITLFSEEVIRGGLAFALGMLVRHLSPILRQAAHLGNWQVISKGPGQGRLEVVADLRSVQGKCFDAPTVIVADKIAGDEEIPGRVTAVVTSAEVDILSHMAVRARNAKVLLATCYDSRTMDKLKALAGRVLRLELSAAGDVTFQEGESSAVPSRPPVANRPKIARPQFTAYAIVASQFNEKLVGGKSWNQVRLRPKLPGWVHQPASAAVPFGVFERVLALDHNQALADRYTALLSNLESNASQTLAELREAVLKLSPPDDLARMLRQVMDSAGLPRLDETPHSWDAAWTCIKRVWASKWNERAYLSRKASGFADEDLFMAVLIQQVVDAEYAFVIHTVNPLNGARGELYGEVVLGLGETLVANYLGRALSFACDKATLKPGIVAYPSKSVGLYGNGLIFRSDSNGEDLAGYAGAGLYDSVLLNPPREVRLDYSRERLVWDDAFRSDLLVSIAKIGAEVEKALGSPQDIEGAYSHGKYYVVQTRPQVG